MMGYLKDAEATKKAIRLNGFLHTGDLGSINKDGFLKVLGRVSDIITLASGEKFQVNPLEQYICDRIPAFSHFMVVGDGRPHLGALITVKLERDEKTGLPTKRIREDVREWMKNTWKVEKI